MMEITSQTKTIALIGHPVHHSLSPIIQNIALQACGLSHVYLAHDVAPSALGRAVQGMKALGYIGWNVTIPHKVEIISHLDELDETASEIGAVNTVVNHNGRLIGYNTDGMGYIRSLQEEMNFDLRGKKVLMVGSGGAARAV